MRMKKQFGTMLMMTLVLSVACVYQAGAADWAGFRGPDGAGVSQEKNIPTRFGDKINLKWKTTLAGPGASSPIVVGSRVFITAYSGYGLSKDNIGEKDQLARHLYCLDRQNGKVLWQKTVKALMPEDDYRGYISEHGFATSTPVSDGKRVYVFFGKTGVLAFDFDGNRLWHSQVGDESSDKKWGSASSLLLYKDSVIVAAADENQAIIALDTRTGKEKWKAQGAAYNHVYATPALIKGAGGVDEIVVNMPEEVWGLDANTGKMRWFVKTGLPGNICPSIVVGDGVIYAFGGFPKHGALAIKTGGKGDVTSSHIKWSVGNNPYVVTPVLTGGKLYWVNNKGEAVCQDTKDGSIVYTEKVGGDRRGAKCYASPLLIGDKLYVVSREAGILVIATGDTPKVIEQNHFAADKSIFNASPAVSNGQLFIRSNEAIYCVEALASE